MTTRLSIGMLMALLVASAALAQSYPTRAVRIVAPFAPGGAADILARMLAQRLQESDGQPAAVDHRPGAGGNIGAELVAKAAPDGYTLMMSTASIAVNVSLYSKLNHNLQRDLEVIAREIEKYAKVIRASGARAD